MPSKQFATEKHQATYIYVQRTLGCEQIITPRMMWFLRRTTSYFALVLLLHQLSTSFFLVIFSHVLICLLLHYIIGMSLIVVVRLVLSSFFFALRQLLSKTWRWFWMIPVEESTVRLFQANKLGPKKINHVERRPRRQRKKSIWNEWLILSCALWQRNCENIIFILPIILYYIIIITI